MDNEALKLHQAQIVKTLIPYLMALPQSKINEASLVVYARALSSLGVAQIDAAMLKLMRTVKFFPTIAEIFEQVDNIQQFASKSEVPSENEAWHEAMRLAHDKFLYGKWECSCREVELAIKQFGKQELCTLESDNVNTARAQFMRIYNSIVNRERDRKVNGTILKALPQKALNEIIGGLASKMSVLEGGKAEKKMDKAADNGRLMA